MPYDPNEDDEIIIRNGTLRQLLNYTLKDTPIKTWHILLLVGIAAFLLGVAL